MRPPSDEEPTGMRAKVRRETGADHVVGGEAIAVLPLAWIRALALAHVVLVQVVDQLGEGVEDADAAVPSAFVVAHGVGVLWVGVCGIGSTRRRENVDGDGDEYDDEEATEKIQ